MRASFSCSVKVRSGVFSRVVQAAEEPRTNGRTHWETYAQANGACCLI